jgi:hypothetical protein
MWFQARSLAALVSVVALSSCGGGSAATSAPPTPNFNFTMLAQNHSAVSGSGNIVQSTGSFTVTVKLTGLAPNSSHISHVHAGKCSQPGGIVYALVQVIADASGAATATTTVPSAYLVPASGWYVNVHHGPDFTEADYAPSDSCGDLSAS